MNKYYLGKCDGYGNGRKSCEAYITWEIREDGEFSMQAEIWNNLKTDIISGGQCVDTVAAYFPHDKKARRMVEIWKRWHLNHMNAGCEHQRIDWQDQRIPVSELPESHANRDDKGILAIWVYPEEHPKGLLMKPCAICGYKYGSQWLKEELPADVRAEIESWQAVAV